MSRSPRNRPTRRTAVTLPLVAALAVGLGACGGDDDDAAVISVPEITAGDLSEFSLPSLPDVSMPDLTELEEMTGGTLPGGVTIPDIDLGDLSDVTLPGGVTIPEIDLGDFADVTTPDFSGEGGAAFCAQLESLADAFESTDGESPEDFAQMMAAYDQIIDDAPAEIAGDIATMRDAVAGIAVAAQEVNDQYGPDSTDPAAMNAMLELMFGMMAQPGLMQASANLEAYSTEVCQLDM